MRYKETTDLLSVFTHICLHMVLQVEVSSGTCMGVNSSTSSYMRMRGKIAIFKFYVFIFIHASYGFYDFVLVILVVII